MGDWVCTRCHDLQFARNIQCRMCGAAQPPVGASVDPAVVQPGSGQSRGGRGRGGGRSTGQSVSHRGSGRGGRQAAGGFLPRHEHDNPEDSWPSREGEETVEECISCPSHLTGVVIGRQGCAIGQLRRETRCAIVVEPLRSGQDFRTITVRGARPAVKEALVRISTLINQKATCIAAPPGRSSDSLAGQSDLADDRHKTSLLLDHFECCGILKRAWLDERCMEVLMSLPYQTTARALQAAYRMDLWATTNVSALVMNLVKAAQLGADLQKPQVSPGDESDQPAAAWTCQVGLRPQHDFAQGGGPWGAEVSRQSQHVCYTVPWVHAVVPQVHLTYGLSPAYPCTS